MTRKSAGNVLGTVGSSVLALYFMVAGIIFIPYYNWQYAREHGFFSWLLLGEFVPTGKALVWPYFVFFGDDARPKAPLHFNGGGAASATVESTPPAFSADEMDRYSAVLKQFDKRPFTDAELSELREVAKDYEKRTGCRTAKEDFDVALGGMQLVTDYLRALGESLLISWDRQEPFTTSEYDRLRQEIEAAGARKPEKLARDRICLQAAARNQRYVEDVEGKFEFGREIILQHNRETEVMAANWQRMAKMFDEMAH